MKLRDKLLNVTDQEYREIQAFSYSLLKSLDEEGPQILLEQKSSKGPALEFGQLVDILLTNPDRKDEIFWTKTVEKPTASLLELANSIISTFIIEDKPFSNLTDGIVDSHITNLGIWSNIKDENKLKAKYDNDIFYEYIKNSIDAKGKILLTQETLDSASHCANVLLTHDYTRHLFVETEDIEVIYQASILYPFKKTKGKARLDLVRVDHKNKLIYPYDIKTGAKLPSKFEDSFYEFKYYLQVVSYLLALKYIVESCEEFKDYKIQNFTFIYSSKKLPDVPSIFEVDNKLLNSYYDGWNGNTGFGELVDNYKYAIDNGIYNVERKIITNEGKLKINLR